MKTPALYTAYHTQFMIGVLYIMLHTGKCAQDCGTLVRAAVSTLLRALPSKKNIHLLATFFPLEYASWILKYPQKLIQS